MLNIARFEIHYEQRFSEVLLHLLLFSISINKVPPYIYYEFVDCGTLRDFLLRSCRQSHGKNVESRRFIHLAFQVAMAMNFLGKSEVSYM